MFLVVVVEEEVVETLIPAMVVLVAVMLTR